MLLIFKEKSTNTDWNAFLYENATKFDQAVANREQSCANPNTTVVRQPQPNSPYVTNVWIREQSIGKTMCVSILVTLFCCPPLGCVALIFERKYSNL